jgi:hypothetical protein
MDLIDLQGAHCNSSRSDSSGVETVLCNFGLGSVVQALELVQITQESFNPFPSPIPV